MQAVDFWPNLPPVRQLPADVRLWAWWLRHGPRRAEGTLGGSAMYRTLASIRRAFGSERYATLVAPPRASLVIDLLDFESFHHAFPVWYREDEEAMIVARLVDPDTAYVDAGASFGVYALIAARAGAGVVCAIEPQPHLAEAIRRSARVNRFENMIVFEAAASDSIGTVDLLIDESGSGSASLRRLPAGVVRRLPVKTLTLDSLDVGRVGLIKLDVEDGEEQALRGAAAILECDAPFVIFEAGARQQQGAVFALLQSFGYAEFFDQASVRENALVPPRFDQMLTNIIAVPDARRAVFRQRIFDNR